MPNKKYKTDEERKAAKRLSQRKYYLKNKDRILAFQDAWYLENKSRVKENLKKWRAKNKKQVLDTDKKWRNNNIEKSREKGRRCYHKHVEKRSAQSKVWRKKNPHLGPLYHSLRRKRCRLHLSANKNKISEKYIEAKSASLVIKHVVDHIIPVAAGGWHHEDNLQVIEKRINSSKKDKAFWISPHVGIKDWRDVPRELWPVDLVPQYLALIEKHKGETIRWDAAA